MASKLHSDEIKTFYESFDAPITAFDCGRKCAPYNERGVPFCCDTRHAVPTAYQAEWSYLLANTHLWHLWQAQAPAVKGGLREQTPDGMVLIECLGHQHCQRDYRSITCRAFPFFPYLNRAGEFVGLTYYWEYEERCWVINNLGVVTIEYRSQFAEIYDTLLDREAGELMNFGYHSKIMRQVFAEHKREIPLLHRDGEVYKITPDNERLRLINPEDLPKFGPYQIAAQMPFPDEVSEQQVRKPVNSRPVDQ